MPVVERARPLLGTIVSIRAEAADQASARGAIEAAFDEIAHIHERMSFQSPHSDLAAIGRLRAGETCRVDPRTATCLAAALLLAEESDGVFDPVVAGDGASWQDVALAGATVRARRPLRLDLSGIAKGAAVDRACDRLSDACASGLVNAGGDLRLFGPAGETIVLTTRHAAPPAGVYVENGALASSDAAGSIEEYGEPQHRDGRTGAVITVGFVSVAAPLCRDADALTKVVLALGGAAEPLLVSRGAVAYLHDPRKGWWCVGGEA